MQFMTWLKLLDSFAEGYVRGKQIKAQLERERAALEDMKNREQLSWLKAQKEAEMMDDIIAREAARRKLEEFRAEYGGSPQAITAAVFKVKPDLLEAYLEQQKRLSEARRKPSGGGGSRGGSSSSDDYIIIDDKFIQTISR